MISQLLLHIVISFVEIHKEDQNVVVRPGFYFIECRKLKKKYKKIPVFDRHQQLGHHKSETFFPREEPSEHTHEIPAENVTEILMLKNETKKIGFEFILSLNSTL